METKKFVSQSEKREWEVGHKGNYDEIDDGRSLKR